MMRSGKSKRQKTDQYLPAACSLSGRVPVKGTGNFWVIEIF